MSVDRYVGCMVNIVYMDRKGKITKRRIFINAAEDGLVRAHCFTSKGPRAFSIENVLAFELVQRNAG